MGTRPITWTINYPNGEPWSGGVVTVELLQGFTTATEVYPATTIEFTSDADGTNPSGAALGVPDSGTAYYKITKPNQTYFRVYLAAGATVDLVTLETLAGSSVDEDEVLTLLSAGWDITTVTGTYAVLATDEYINVTSGTFNITLEDATGARKPYIIDNIDGTGTVTLLPTGSNTINGASSWPIYPGEAYGIVRLSATAWRAS